MIKKSTTKWSITIYGLLVVVCLNVSTAAGMVSIPSLYGLTEKQAREALAAVGVKGQVHVKSAGTGTFDCERNDVPAGRVCGQSPAPEGEQPAELEVWVFLKMAEKISMYSFVNWDVKKAKERYRMLGGKGVVNTKEVGESECDELSGRRDIEKGKVCGRDPHEEEISPDMPITLYLQGARTIDDKYGYPPDVSGMSLDEAISVLTEFRFTYLSVKFSDDKECQPGIVCSEWDGLVKLRQNYPYPSLDIVVGSNYRRDKRAQGLRMPNLLGLTPSKGRDRLDALGVRGSIRIHNPEIDGGRGCTSSDVIRDRGQVCHQSRSPGEQIDARMSLILLTLETRNKPDAEMAGRKPWIPMPETVGMSVSEASAMLKEKGFKRMTVERVDQPGCEPNIVCASSVKAGERGYLDTPKVLFVGIVYPSQENKRSTELTEETQKTPLKSRTDEMKGDKDQPKPFF